MTTKEQQEFEKKVLDQFMSGKSLFGKDGAFAPMLKKKPFLPKWNPIWTRMSEPMAISAMVKERKNSRALMGLLI